MSRHLKGRPVSASTYRAHGCRCTGCCQAATDYRRELRHKNGTEPSIKVYKRADSAAARWVREWHPDVWKAIVAVEYERFHEELRRKKRVS